MTITADTSLVFKYLNILPVGGRGGVTRFFMLTQGIKFDEDLVAMSEWPKEKQRLVESGENPSGSVPVLYAGGAPHPQHIAAIRYLARVYKLTSGDEYKDYVQDLVADEYHSFRDQWVTMTFSATDDEKAEYRKGDLVKHLTKFNALYESFKTEDTFLSVSSKTGQPLWGDAAIFGLLRDHIVTGHMSLDDLKAYPRLSALHAAYGAIPSVKEWLEGLNKKQDEKKSEE